MQKINESTRRRSTVTQYVDVSNLLAYYGRKDIFISFTDDGDFETNSLDDRSRKPEGVIAYPINDVVGRRVKSSTLYARVFRYTMDSSKTIRASRYTRDDLGVDVMFLRIFFEDIDRSIYEHIDVLHSESSTKAESGNAFSMLWYILKELSVMWKGSQYDDAWRFLITEVLNKEAIYDDRANGSIVQPQTDVIYITNEFEAQDLEVVHIQKFKKEMNTYIRRKIERFNTLTSVSNARRRIKK